MTEELEALKKISKMLTTSINNIQEKIDQLKKMIDHPGRSQNITQIKRDHHELCKKCDALRKTRKTCVMQIENVKIRRDKQNDITRQRRDYIGTHFGKKGEIWHKRIMERHKR